MRDPLPKCLLSLSCKHPLPSQFLQPLQKLRNFVVFELTTAPDSMVRAINTERPFETFDSAKPLIITPAINNCANRRKEAPAAVLTFRTTLWAFNFTTASREQHPSKPRACWDTMVLYHRHSLWLHLTAGLCDLYARHQLVGQSPCSILLSTFGESPPLSSYFNYPRPPPLFHLNLSHRSSWADGTRDDTARVDKCQFYSSR
ncbi:hypothetical protein V8F33_001798 [Rhypophila sp. PSN 637]